MKYIFALLLVTACAHESKHQESSRKIASSDQIVELRSDVSACSTWRCASERIIDYLDAQEGSGHRAVISVQRPEVYYLYDSSSCNNTTVDTVRLGDDCESLFRGNNRQKRAYRQDSIRSACITLDYPLPIIQLCSQLGIRP